jgi:uncharacterized protein YcbX
MTMVSAQISGLFVYPVKSMKGISADRALLTETGLLHDRRWMVVDGEGRFQTQRNQPRLALVTTRLESDGVVLSLDGHGSVSIPFESAGGAPVRTKVWQDSVEAVDEGDEVADWLTGALGAADGLRIVRMAPEFRRRLTQAERFGDETTTQFADSAPFLVANEASLEALNRDLESNGHAPVPMNRFRPNIVMRGPGPFSEHRAAALAGDGWRLAMVDHCERCVVTTIDQETAERDPAREPFQTLRRINPAPGPRGAPAFAQNAKLESGAGTVIATGAEILLH